MAHKDKVIVPWILKISLLGFFPTKPSPKHHLFVPYLLYFGLSWPQFAPHWQYLNILNVLSMQTNDKPFNAKDGKKKKKSQIQFIVLDMQLIP